MHVEGRLNKRAKGLFSTGLNCINKAGRRLGLLPAFLFLTLVVSCAKSDFEYSAAGMSCGVDSQITPSPIKRLSKTEYINSLEEVLSQLTSSQREEIMLQLETALSTIPMDIKRENSDRSLPRFSRHYGETDETHVKSYLEISFFLAEILLKNTTLQEKFMSVCGSSQNIYNLKEETCLDKFLTYYAKKTLRRPFDKGLNKGEAEAYKELYKSYSSADEGFTAIMVKLLNNPDFIYQKYNSGNLISGNEGVDAVYELNSYERAAKFTSLLWQAPPDDGLHKLLESDSRDLNKVAEYILNSPKAQRGVKDFIYEWLQLNRISELNDRGEAGFKTLADGVALGGELREQMIEEIKDLIAYHYKNNGSYDDLLNSRVSVVKERELADLYDIKQWDGKEKTNPLFPEGERSGLLTRSAMLVSQSPHTKPVRRGVLIRREILCDELPEPPADIDNPEIDAGLHRSTREIYDTLLTKTSCAGCHALINPLGYASEIYDSLGRYRKVEQKFDEDGVEQHRLPIDSVSYPKVFQGDRVETQDIVDLSAYIVETGKGQACYSQRLVEYAFGHEEKAESGGCSVNTVQSKLSDEKASLKSVMKELFFLPEFHQRQVL